MTEKSRKYGHEVNVDVQPSLLSESEPLSLFYCSAVVKSSKDLHKVPLNSNVQSSLLPESESLSPTVSFTGLLL
jgi:hypothetical protein